MEFADKYLKQIWSRFVCVLPFYIVYVGSTILNFLTPYVLFCTNFWFIPALYIFWMLVFDREICETGGRKTLFLRQITSFPCYTNYFPLKFHLSSPYKLDPKKNYFFICFPHGFIPYGVGNVFVLKSGGFKDFFPDHEYRIATLYSNFFIPVVREILLLFGLISVSEKSLNYVLGDRKGGNAVAIVPGGVKEIKYCTESDYHVIINNRKGFVRVALKNGSPLIPVFQFGLNSVYKTYKIPGLSWLKPLIGFQPTMIYGRGVFQEWFGFVPLPRAVTTIAGEPIDVQKCENPTRDQIDALHKRFTDSLLKLFEEHKLQYDANGKNVKLIFH